MTIGSAADDVNYTSYTKYGVRSTEYRDEREKDMDNTYMYYIYVEKGVIGLFTFIVELFDSLFPIGLDLANLNIDHNTITYNI